jgi:hypothetical protein
VLKESRAAIAGFRGGDTLLEIAGQPAGEDLKEFAGRYLTSHENASKKRELLRFKVRRSTGETESLALRIPPSWSNAFEE